MAPRNGDTQAPLEVRLWRRVARGSEDECWEWNGYRRRGYGTMNVGGHTRGTHRVAWMVTYGQIPQGMLVCHLCDNRACCNPKHLFLGTAKDNTQDMHLKGRFVSWNKGKESPMCKHGHIYNGARDTRGHQRCTECRRKREAARRAARRVSLCQAQ